MAVTVREIERKYAVTPAFVLPRLGAVSGVVTARTRRTVSLEAVYYDTDDLRLARNRITLRRRTGGADAGWHLKLPVRVGQRDELRLPLTASEGRIQIAEGARHTPPAEFVDLVAVHARGAQLRPVARLRTLRTARRLRDATGSDLAEVVDDQVSAQTLGESTTLSTWREIEVELVDGGPEVLDAVEELLFAAGAVTAADSSKLARLLGPALAAGPGPDLPTAPRRLRRSQPAGEVVRAYLIEQVRALLAADPRVRLDEPEAVHRMRVACRRARSALRIFAPLFPARTVAQLDIELRDLAGALSAARDAEVQLAYFDGRVAELPAALVAGEVHEVVRAHLDTGLAAGREQALEMLRSERYLTLIDSLLALVQAPLTGEARKPARSVLPTLVRRADQALARKVSAAARLPVGHERDELLHTARKQAKRLRYAAEIVSPLYGTKAAKLADAAAQAQELLGIHQDATVARDLLRAWGIAAQAQSSPTAFTLGVLYGLEECRGRLAERDFFDAWPAISAPRHRGWLS
ncbi:CYTH and CHAD domain-containing protein [Frankia sp. Ag45/Mut15]|uniref:CYTH and CHAD domain-containing protein n=1 Tax=Frankia umida TaxID=573489 RepID=A0ABT0JVG1_9ACTN|nr:CYTH and CHAD domain-containing protein [Frankia umida]MCK9875537.1 CYTH and CHAD domain-containing protein [Frankia umida]